MRPSTVLYCAADFESVDGGFLNLALTTCENNWFYAEVIDYSPDKLDDQALKDVVPRLMKVPRARFLRHHDVPAELSQYLTDIGAKSLEIRTMGEADPRLKALMIAASMDAGLISPPAFHQADIDPERFESFLRHCGGGERTAGHPLVRVTGAAICDQTRTAPTRFSDGSIHHFELLMGSKNAGSYRAWARNQEREWAESHTESGAANAHV